MDAAAGDGAGAIEAAEGASLGPVGEPGGAAEVEFAGGVEHDPVAHHHPHHIGGGFTGEVGEDPGRDLDREPPGDL